LGSQPIHFPLVASVLAQLVSTLKYLSRTLSDPARELGLDLTLWRYILGDNKRQF